MDRITVAEAARLLENMVNILDDAYWEASEITQKDTFHDITHVFQDEISELAKLSVEDHYMAYEPVTANFRNIQPKLRALLNNVDIWVLRTGRAQQIAMELPNVINLLNCNN